MTKIQTAAKSTYKTHKKTKLIFKDKQTVMMCILSVSAAHSNIHLMSLPLIFILCCRDRQSRNVSAVITVLYLGANAVSNSFYVPYMSFVFVYIVAEYLLKRNKQTALYSAALLFAAVKGYVLTFGFSDVYKAVFIMEIVSFLLAPQMIKSGAELLRENAAIASSVQLAECAVAVVATALALSGIKIWGVDIPVCFLMSLCFFYSAKDNIALSMLSVIAAVFMQWQSVDFPFIFAGFMAVGFASFALLQRGYAGYFTLIAVSFGVTLAFITQFNSFIFLITTSISLTVCFAAARYHSLPVKITGAETVGEKDYLTLMANVDRLGRAFRFLGNTVTDISNLIAKDDVSKDIQNIVANEICRRCRNNHICWQQYYDHTQQQFSSFEYALWKGKPFDFDRLFLERCDKSPQIIQSFTSAHRLLSTRRLIHQAGRHQQQMLQNQFFTMAQTLQDIVYRSKRSGIANTAFTHTMNSFLLAMGKKINYCLCFQNKNRCIISINEYFLPAETDRIKLKLESIYNKRFAPPSMENEDDGFLYTFCEVPQFSAEVSYKSKSRYSTCGDICEEFAADEYTYIILTDGMGTGSFAAAESRTAVAMLKSLMTAGITPKTAVDITNIALNLKGTGQSCVALDILQINCYSGEGVLYKAGAAPSVIINSGKSRNIYKDSLPVGILKDTKLAEEDFILKNGDTVIMMSDGIKLERPAVQKITLMSEKCSTEQLAEYVMSQQNSTDDATVAVIKLTRC